VHRQGNGESRNQKPCDTSCCGSGIARSNVSRHTLPDFFLVELLPKIFPLQDWSKIFWYGDSWENVSKREGLRMKGLPAETSEEKNLLSFLKS
jgi:hypothetical protein